MAHSDPGQWGPPARSLLLPLPPRIYKTNHLPSPPPSSLPLFTKRTPSPPTTKATRLQRAAAGSRIEGGRILQRRRHGEVPVLRAGAHQQGRVDKGGGPAPHRLHQGPRRGVLEVAPQGRRAAAVREELPAAVDQLPPPRPQTGKLHRGGGRAHHQVPRALRQQVVADRREAAGEDGQRDQELLEHAHQAQAPRPRHRPADAPPDRRRRQRRAGAAAALPAGGCPEAAARRRRRRSGPPPPPPPGPFRGHLQLARGGLQPQQRRRAAVRHSSTGAGRVAAAAPRHRPQPVHQPGALPAAGGAHQQATEAGSGGGDADDGSWPPQCDGGGVPVPQQPRVPAGRGVRLRRRRLRRRRRQAGAMGSGFFTGSTLLQRPIVV